MKNFGIMTEEQIITVSIFEDRVNQLLSLCDRLKKENAELRLQIESGDVSKHSLQREIESLTKKYDNLKMAKMISVGQTDFTSAKDKLTKLVREVDECIALLND